MKNRRIQSHQAIPQNSTNIDSKAPTSPNKSFAPSKTKKKKKNRGGKKKGHRSME
jgi:hypothetical protein